MDFTQAAYNYFYLTIPFFAITFFLFIYLSRNSNYSVLDANNVNIWFISSALTLLLILFIQKYVLLDELVRYTSLFIAYFSGVFISTDIFGKTKFHSILIKTLKSTNSNDYRSINVLSNVSFLVYFFGQGFFSLLMVINGSAAAERLTLSKQFTIIQFLVYASLSIYSTCFSFLYLIDNGKIRTKTKLQLLLLCVGVFSGSKAGLIFILMVIFSITQGSLAMLSEQSRLEHKKFIKILLIFAVVTVIGSSMLVNSVSLPGFIDSFVNDNLMRGDLYMLLLANTDISKYYDVYDPIKYFLHPFFLLFGGRGYDIPLGTRVLQDATGAEIGGPNTHLPILIDVLFRGNIIFNYIVCFFSGFLSYMLRSWYEKKFLPGDASIASKILVFTPVFYISNFLMDPSVYAYVNLVSVLIFSVTVIPLLKVFSIKQ